MKTAVILFVAATLLQGCAPLTVAQRCGTETPASVPNEGDGVSDRQACERVRKDPERADNRIIDNPNKKGKFRL